jgi:putative DNA primase/helicase
VRNALKASNVAASEARKFSLRRYTDAAKHALKERQHQIELQKAVLRRNSKLKVVGGTDHEVRGAADIADDDIRVLSLSPSSFHRAQAVLRQYRTGRIWFDEFYNHILTDWDGTASDAKIEPRRISDSWVLECYSWMMMEDAKLCSMSRGKAEEAVTVIAHRDVRNEPQEWLKSLKWDGTERLTTWLSDTYGVPRNDKHYADIGRCWLVSVAARIMKPGCEVHTMPVLMGKQGTKKSKSLAVLGGKWYSVLNTSIDKQENFLMLLQGVLIGEVAELDAFGKAENTRIKTMLSTAVDSFKMPYARHGSKHPRTCVLAGTTNEMSWHRDETGARRFWPIRCEAVNLDWLRENRDQLFAEALARYERDEQWWDFDEAENERRVFAHHTAHPWQDYLAAWIETETAARRCWLKRPGDGVKTRASVVTTSRLLLEAMNMPLVTQSRQTSNVISQCMQALGYCLKNEKIPGNGQQKVFVAMETATQKSLDLLDGE